MKIHNHTTPKNHKTQPHHWLALCCFLSAGPLSAAYNLQLSYWLNTQGLAQAVRIGDVTGDGLQDVVLVNNGYGGQLTNHLLIYPGNALGGLSAPITMPYSTSVSGRRGLVLINTDGDDALEIVVGHGHQLTLFNQHKDQSFMTTALTTPYAN